ncbi:MAG: hypothetical protein IKQ94_01830 [Bacteroidales bacterium]|nr:hypothetical protein [Bacteroidales bacterium]
MNHKREYVRDIKTDIDKKDRGFPQKYNDCKSDTDTAINLLQSSFKHTNFVGPDVFITWFINNFCTNPPVKSSCSDKSYYRAFLTKQNDHIVVFRISQHFATKSGMNRHRDYTGVNKPDKMVHLIVDRIPNTKNKPLASSDLDANDPQSGVNFSHDVYELSAEQIKDPVMIGRLADALVSELTDGTKVNINESETDRLIPTRHVLTFEEYEEFLAILEDGQRA